MKKALTAIISYLALIIIIPELVLLFLKLFIDNEVLISALGNFIIYIFLTVTIICIYGKDLKSEWKRFKSSNNKTENLITSYLLCLAGSMIGSFILNLMGLGDTDSVNQKEIVSMLHSNYALLIIPTILLAPLIEELVFRKAIFTVFEDTWHFSSYAVILVSAILFGLLHVIFNLDQGIQELLMAIPYVTIGLGLAFSYVKNDHIIIYPIFAHFVNNLLSIIIIFIM